MVSNSPEDTYDSPLNTANASFETERDISGERTGPRPERDWIVLAQQAYETSSTFMTTSVRSDWERNYRLFGSEHTIGSKYSSDAYRHRSKIFRPRTRASVRKNETAAAAAFFSTLDVVNIRAENDSDPAQAASADLMKHLMNYRLTRTIPWFLTCMGAFQDTNVVGLCVSKQYWRYSERQTGEERYEAVDPDTGDVYEAAEPITAAEHDGPVCELVPPENIRIDGGSDWIDPINSSPFLIVITPMYAVDVKSRMKALDPKTGQPQWRHLSDEMLSRSRADRDNDKGVRQAREGNRTDSTDNSHAIRDHDIVWVHENFIRIDDEDWQFWTMGTEALLSDPLPAREVYPHAPRPYVMGYTVLEAHKVYPTSKVGLTYQLQMELNDITNLRLDNVKLHLLGRYFVRAGRNVDLKSLTRGIPGAVTMVSDVTEDIRWERPQDITSSSYQEQDRLNVEFDEVAGSFGQASVSSNRQLNETVGGMDLLAGSAAGMTEYDLRVFTETWVEPVLRQLVRLEQMYETDDVVLGIAAQKAQLFQRYGIDRITDDLLEREMTLNVNVGIGATDPQRQLAQFRDAVQTIGGLIGPQMAQMLDIGAIIEEVFGKAGYRDGSRFFTIDGDPRTAQLQAQIAEMQNVIGQLQAAVADQEAERQTKIAVAQIQAGATSRKSEVEAMKDLATTDKEVDSRQRAEQIRSQTQLRSAEIKADTDRRAATADLLKTLTSARIKADSDRGKAGLASLTAIRSAEMRQGASERR